MRCFKKIIRKILASVLITSIMFFSQPLLPIYKVFAQTITPLFSDNFDRPDSPTLDNGWIEFEGTGAAVEISNNKLFFSDTSDVLNRPMAKHDFPKATSGKVTFRYDFNWARIASEASFAVFMQLGDGQLMTEFNQDTGVAVNLMWGGTKTFMDKLVYKKDGFLTQITGVNGLVNLNIVADLNLNTYEVRVNDVLVGTNIPFDDVVDVDTVRFFTSSLNEANFAGRTFDNLEIILESPNNPPQAFSDTAVTNEDTAVDIAVLANDTDPDNDPLSVSSVTPGANGSTSVNLDNTVRYTPNTNFNGTDSFTYTLNDGNGGTAQANVGVTVTAVNDAPQAVEDAYSLTQDTTLVTTAFDGVLANDIDVENDPLSATLITGVQNGVLDLFVDGSFSYTPVQGFVGSDTFTYQASDGLLSSNLSTVTITVNRINNSPVAAADSYSAVEDTPLTVVAPGVLGNDSDADLDPLSTQLVSGPTSGSLTLNPDGSFSYTANPNFNGVDSFIYQAFDGIAYSNAATANINISPVNDAPVAQDQIVTTPAGAGVPITLQATDVDQDSLTYEIVTQPTNGTLTGTAPNVVYTPNPTFSGADSFTFKANDTTVDSNIAQVSITVESPQGPLPGQIMVAPGNPAWLVYNKDEDQNGQLDPFFMAGPGDPEDFLYRGTLNPDGTRNGDQTSIINQVSLNGGNSLYMQIVRSHGGDGGTTHNPFVNSNPTLGLDQDILNQWETWFTTMDSNGIVIYLFFYDDGSRIWDTGDTVGPEEQAFIAGLVDRFEQHKNLIWVVAEEYQERYTSVRVSNIAAAIRQADDNDHVIGVHKLDGNDFSEFADDPNIEQFAMQKTVTTNDPAIFHSETAIAYNLAGGRYNLNYSESSPETQLFKVGNRTQLRKIFWAVATGGAYHMAIGAWVNKGGGTPTPEMLADMKRVQMFFEMTNLTELAPHDELAFGNTNYVMAKPGFDYVAYGVDATENLGVKSMLAGTYKFTWLDTVTGTQVVQTSVAVSAGDQMWTKPAGLGNEIVVYVTNVSL